MEGITHLIKLVQFSRAVGMFCVHLRAIDCYLVAALPLVRVLSHVAVRDAQCA